MTARELPALVEFARGYLHEDLAVEHGDVLQALAAYARDAGPAGQVRLGVELARVVREAEQWSPADLSRFFARDIRCAWQPDSALEIAELARRVRAG
jgi:hypothetical protein